MHFNGIQELKLKRDLLGLHSDYNLLAFVSEFVKNKHLSRGNCISAVQQATPIRMSILQLTLKSLSIVPGLHYEYVLIYLIEISFLFHKTLPT